ncbi:precorrin-4 C(11)-methyltransferase [Fusibacter bizertensis]|uniref:Precorrin-4 C(11)-methyltransferase n=1 Tax=Fusibacter bizertensis TaxID=1488331 RepID=A0ABT6NGZ2_9FIRM|nr:precorrin-4 C(11)-methyltransferase [Fusibacter bizertensis]MDH8679703.1 precorrin-4 C(11)-methyltransferase [Fusibacter bizertensis]
MKVKFVGAGPGDPELLTIKGHRALSEADIVIYAGSLVNPELLNYCKPNCKIYNSAFMNLEEIIKVCDEGISQDRQVVRLHTGDFSIFGSLREQIEALNALEIGFELIPGVSSFLGAASALEIEYTIPEISQSLIITRMEGRTPVPTLESIESYAAHQTSMAIFLSSGMVDEVMAQLIRGGYPPQTPAAMVYKATWPDQKIIRGTIETLDALAKEAQITKTALIIVGNCLGYEFNPSKLYDKDFAHEFRG